MSGIGPVRFPVEDPPDRDDFEEWAMGLDEAAWQRFLDTPLGGPDAVRRMNSLMRVSTARAQRDAEMESAAEEEMLRHDPEHGEDAP